MDFPFQLQQNSLHFCRRVRGSKRQKKKNEIIDRNEASEPKFYIVVAENDMTRKGRREGIAIAGRGGCRYMKTCESPNFASPATAAKIPRQSTRSRSPHITNVFSFCQSGGKIKERAR